MHGATYRPTDKARCRVACLGLKITYLKVSNWALFAGLIVRFEARFADATAA